MRIFIDALPRWSGGYIRYIQGIFSPGLIPDDIEVIIYGTPKLFKELRGIDSRIKFIEDSNIPENPFKLLIWRYKYLPVLFKKYNPDIHFSLSGYVDYIKYPNLARIVLFRNVEPFMPVKFKDIKNIN